jgi:hypothetical protein
MKATQFVVQLSGTHMLMSNNLQIIDPALFEEAQQEEVATKKAAMLEQLGMFSQQLAWLLNTIKLQGQFGPQENQWVMGLQQQTAQAMQATIQQVSAARDEMVRVFSHDFITLDFSSTMTSLSVRLVPPVVPTTEEGRGSEESRGRQDQGARRRGCLCRERHVRVDGLEEGGAGSWWGRCFRRHGW